MRKYITKIILISISIILAYCTKSLCVESGTVRMAINGGTVWTNIDVSQAYAECESLNSATSTLGTTQLRAHLTTDADWSAMAIFTVSQYGIGISGGNAPAWTTGNNSGIKGIGDKYIFTTGILSKATSSSTSYTYGLFESDGTTPKKYIRKWDASDREGTNFVGFSQDKGTYGWFSSWKYWGESTSYPISVKMGLFDVAFGYYSSVNFNMSGAPNANFSFRPVIWN